MTTEPQGEAKGEPQGDPKPQDPKPQGDGQEDTKPQGEGESKPQGDGDGTDWKAEARKWEKAAKKDAAERTTATAQLEKIQELLSGKDAEKSAAEQAAADAKLEAVKYRVAYEAGLPPDLAERLKGKTEEELKADAEDLAKYAKATKKPKTDANADDEGKGSGGKKKPNDLLREWATGAR